MRSAMTPKIEAAQHRCDPSLPHKTHSGSRQTDRTGGGWTPTNAHTPSTHSHARSRSRRLQRRRHLEAPAARRPPPGLSASCARLARPARRARPCAGCRRTPAHARRWLRLWLRLLRRLHWQALRQGMLRSESVASARIRSGWKAAMANVEKYSHSFACQSQSCALHCRAPHRLCSLQRPMGGFIWLQSTCSPIHACNKAVYAT